MIVPAEIIKDARSILQDTVAGGYRYSDDSMYRIFNIALREAKRIRPDVYFVDGTIKPVPTVDVSNATTPLPLDDQFYQPFVAYIAGFAELRDDQYTNDGRAVALFNQFKTGLVAM